MRAVAGIACEIDHDPSDLDDEPAPKTVVPIVEPARREMLGRHVGYPCAREFGALPPIEFDRRPDARLCKMTRVAKSGRRTRRPACSHLAQRRQIHVVVMVVGDQEQINAGQRIQALSGPPTRRGPAKSTGLQRSDQIGSVSTQTPPICNKNVEWPMKVADRVVCQCGQEAEG